MRNGKAEPLERDHVDLAVGEERKRFEEDESGRAFELGKTAFQFLRETPLVEIESVGWNDGCQRRPVVTGRQMFSSADSAALMSIAIAPSRFMAKKAAIQEIEFMAQRPTWLPARTPLDARNPANASVFLSRSLQLQDRPPTVTAAASGLSASCPTKSVRNVCEVNFMLWRDAFGGALYHIWLCVL